MVYTLGRRYGVGRERIRELVLPIIGLRGLKLPGKRLLHQALDLCCDKGISFADPYNAALMLVQGQKEIYSHDADLDRIEGIARLEP